MGIELLRWVKSGKIKTNIDHVAATIEQQIHGISSCLFQIEWLVQQVRVEVEADGPTND